METVFVAKLVAGMTRVLELSYRMYPPANIQNIEINPDTCTSSYLLHYT